MFCTLRYTSGSQWAVEPHSHKGPIIPASLQHCTGRFRRSFDYTPDDEIHTGLRAQLCWHSLVEKKVATYVRVSMWILAYAHQFGFWVHGGNVSGGAGAAVGGALHAHHIRTHRHLPLHLKTTTMWKKSNSCVQIWPSKNHKHLSYPLAFLLCLWRFFYILMRYRHWF